MSHILVVDDEEAVCWALERALKKEGHTVSVAASAEDALEVAKKRRPDAVVLDVRLPGIDGLTAMGRLRELSGDAPVIVVTAFGNLGTAVRAVEGGAFDYLSKPFDLHQALDAVGRAQRRGPAAAAPPPDRAGGGNRRPQSRDASGLQAHRPGGAARRLRPDHRRERHR